MTLYWILSVGLGVLALYIIIGNLWIAIAWYSLKKRASMIPFIGGILGSISFFLLPITAVKSFWWIPLLVDLGCVPLFIGIITEEIKKKLNR